MRKWRRRRKTHQRPSEPQNDAQVRPPLREFVYLDDVSLRSLLASQKGAITDQVTDLLSQADEAELASTIGAASPLLKAEVSARYQSTASQGTQTSRRAVAQSLFKELRELDWIDCVLRPRVDSLEVASSDQLVESPTTLRVDHLRRGALVEVDVELVADPIFRFSTIASELTEVAVEFPEVVNQPGAQEGMATLMTGNRFLQRFLAGLIPIRARSTSHVVVEIDGTEYLVLAEEASTLRLAWRPLVVVGVTERASYWRDVRRVLFSRSHFTMLCRVSQGGLRDTWEPVKLAEVLKEVLPDFPDLIADIGRIGLNVPHLATKAATPPIAEALVKLIDNVEDSSGAALAPEDSAATRELAYGIAQEVPDTVAGQNEAFRRLVARLGELGCTKTADEWMELQHAARESAGLELFQSPHESASQASRASESDERLMDTEVIAIYW